MGGVGVQVISEAKTELFQEDKKAGKPRRQSAAAWSTLAQQYNKDIVQVSVNAKKSRLEMQQEEKVRTLLQT